MTTPKVPTPVRPSTLCPPASVHVPTLDHRLTEAKAEYEEQVFDLFEDLDAPPVLLHSAAEYVVQLAGVSFHERGVDEAWGLWALAPPDRRWAAWAASAARDEDSGWLERVEHVWLTRGGALRQALVDIRTGLILQSHPANQLARSQAEGPTT